MTQINFLFLGALFFDTILGDPRGNWHPVVLIGKLITFFETCLWKEKDSVWQKKRAGLLLWIATVGIVYFICQILVYLLALIDETVSYTGNMLLLSFTLSPRTLRKAGKEIYNFLLDGNIMEARRKVGWIVGRDTGKLDEGEVTRATVETVAENITDGIISPLFFAALGGVPLAFAYRAVNTLDSMVGYKNDRYFYFGWASARIDDLFNYVPARITALLILFSAFVLPGYSASNALRMLWRDADKHPSPNSGYAEATVAGALGVRLGGRNYYFGRPSMRAYMGDVKEKLVARHIKKTIAIMYFVTITFVLILTVLKSAL